MNKTITYILVGGASALIGAVAGYFVCKKRLSDKIEDEVVNRVNEGLSRIREANKSRDEKETEEVEITREDLDEAVKIITQEFGEDLNPYRVHILAKTLCECEKKGLSEEATDAKLQVMINEFNAKDEEAFGKDLDEDEDDVEDDDEIEDIQMIMGDYALQPPHVIPLSDYRALPPYFEFLTYHYFERDDVLINDKEEVILDVDQIVGDALIHFDEEEDDGDCVYVLNGQMGLAIEVVRLHKSYANWSGWGS